MKESYKKMFSNPDVFKTKERKGKKFTKEKDKELMDFEECSNYDTSATFYQMNLSRPLMKVCCLLFIIKTYIFFVCCEIHPK